MQFINIDAQTRNFMITEVELDITQGNLYISNRLSDNGKKDYENLLKEAVLRYDEVWLAKQFCFGERMLRFEPRGKSSAKIPKNAPETLAEGEFNRFYMRGLCCRVLKDGNHKLKVYRAKKVNTPRFESEAKIGTIVNAEILLQDLRGNIGIDTALGLPSGPNSGLSVQIQ